MKVLTIWETVSIPLVVLTSIYGMNLKLPGPTAHMHGLGVPARWFASTLGSLALFGVRTASEGGVFFLAHAAPGCSVCRMAPLLRSELH